MKKMLLVWVVLATACWLAAVGGATAGEQHADPGGLISSHSQSTPSLCTEAKRLAYVPERDVCSDALTADVAGQRRPDLVLLYGHPITGAGATLKPFPETLKVVGASGRIAQTTLAPSIPGPGIVAVGNVNASPGDELFIYGSWISSGAQIQVFSFKAGQLVRAKANLQIGGDSADRFSFNCVRTPRPEVIQNNYSLIGPTIYGLWRLTSDTYAWDSASLRLVDRTVTIHHGWPAATGIGAGCDPLAGFH